MARATKEDNINRTVAVAKDKANTSGRTVAVEVSFVNLAVVEEAAVVANLMAAVDAHLMVVEAAATCPSTVRGYCEATNFTKGFFSLLDGYSAIVADFLHF